MGASPGEQAADADEAPVDVGISQGFWMMETEVTQAQWKAVMGEDNPSHFKGDRRPVENVSWEDAQKFVGRLNSSGSAPKGWRFALPSEAQWEYACRAGTRTKYAFGDVLNKEQARFEGTETAEVGKFPANAWGLKDMHGNVWEWCEDWYGEKLHGGLDPKGPSEGFQRVYRGGGWNYIAAFCRAANRYGSVPGYRFYNLGFRPALVPSR
jgi:formylglycine-generating enzyme required for sulfatase activity